jgi:coenzyme F420 hydrogenase subunit beta
MHRCNLCSDALGELADIACGDAWLPEYVANDNRGTSVMIVRDTRGTEFLASVGSVLDLAEVQAGTVIQSQQPAMRAKKAWLRAKLDLARLAGRQTPTYRQALPDPGLKDYGGVARQIAVRWLYRQWHRLRGFEL